MSARAAKSSALRTRTRAGPKDLPALRRLVVSTGVFHPEERAIALELLEERLRRGPKSGYEFIFAERGGELVGYCAWGAVPLTRGSFDLYWIAVAPSAQGLGVGRRLIELAERAVARRGGGRLYIETSSRAAYARTRRFYSAAGFRRAARLADFYAPGDHKVVFCKKIDGGGPRGGPRAARAYSSRESP
ncbi:MAG TPA: GNAT family N-acetyltransferase [Gammaproteobacteria bacterium]|nr:GNAT family N-acetyltransferase [Gammaproteobacteria bacterium]